MKQAASAALPWALPGSFPLIAAFSLGDAFPADGIFGSGSLTLWRFGQGQDTGNFRDTTAYAAMLVRTNLDPSQYLQGWVQLTTRNYSNLDTPFATIKVIDMAFSDTPGESVQIGQTASVHEGGPALLGWLVLAGTVYLGGARLVRHPAQAD